MTIPWSAAWLKRVKPHQVPMNHSSNQIVAVQICCRGKCWAGCQKVHNCFLSLTTYSTHQWGDRFVHHLGLNHSSCNNYYYYYYYYCCCCCYYYYRMECRWEGHYHCPLHTFQKFLKCKFGQIIAKIINNGENVGSKIKCGCWWKYLKSYNSLKLHLWWIMQIAKTNAGGWWKTWHHQKVA